MIVALIDNGSLEPAAHLHLRDTAGAIGRIAGVPVQAVSWKHSDRISPRGLGGVPAPILAPWLRARLAEGERSFLFVPFFASPRGAIGTALRADLENLRHNSTPFDWAIAPGFEPGDLARIAVARVREAIAERGLSRPAVIVVDHGGPSPASAEVRDRVAAEVKRALGQEIGPLAAASMESPDGPGVARNRPLFAELLGTPGFDLGDVVIAPLFLAPGRHAGPGGDLARIAAESGTRFPELRCHFAGLVGTHPLAVDALAAALQSALPSAALQ